MFDIPLGNGLVTRVSALDDGIFRLTTHGLDERPDSLLERYGFIEDLPRHNEAHQENRRVIAGELAIEVDDHGGFRLWRGSEQLAGTLPGTIPATFPTIHGNRGWQLDLEIAMDEKLVGFGDHKRSGFLLNGHREELWLRYPVRHVPVPCFFSSRGYGILFNTTRRLRYDVGTSVANRARFSTESEFLDCWILVGDAFDGLIERYTRITGRPSLPPLKSFGLWLLFHTHAAGHDILSIAARMRDAGIPCDNLGLEPGWMEQYYDYSTAKDWHSERFRGCPHPITYRAGPDGMIHALGRQGYSVGLWLCSRWDFTWEEERRRSVDAPATTAHASLDLAGVELSHVDEKLGHGAEWMDANTRRDEPWFKHLEKFVSDGVRFFKLDPAVLINEFPDRLYGNGRRDDEMHNIAFMLCTKQMTLDFEAFTKRRSFGISVAGWAGFQRFAGTWAGDTGGGKQSLIGILQDAVMGHACATCDMEVQDIAGIHMGFLLPWSLLNSWASFHYPGHQGPVIDGVYREYGRLRMRLLPYLYSLAWRATAGWAALARPLFLAWPHDAVAYEQLGQFLLGDGLLVSCYQDHVILPPGRWFDWWNNRVLHGAWDRHSPVVPSGRGGHLMVRAGALLPMGPEMLHADERPLSEVEWLVFPGDAPSSFTLYRDQGDDLTHRQGAFAAITVTMTPVPGGVDLSWGPLQGGEPERIAGLRHTFVLLAATACTATSAQGALVVTSDAFGNRCSTAQVATGTDVQFRW